MPTLSFFHGLTIQMFWDDHPPPHFHVRYAGLGGRFSIQPLAVMTSNLPPAQREDGSAMGAVAHTGVAGELGTLPARRYPFADPGLAINPPVISERPDDVAEVRAEKNHRLFVRFFDGTAGIVDLHERVLRKNNGVFASLADPEVFAQVGLGFGTVMWANGMDLAPDVLYDEIKRNGIWVLR